jgi:hypothetical protein
VPIAGAVVKKTHVITRGEVVRGFLLLEEGDRCSETRRAESERILRAQTFIADASITTEPSPSGGLILVVHTTDEVSMVLGGTIVTTSPFVRAIELGNSNIEGTTTYLSAKWREGEGYRDAFGGRFQHEQIFGRPYAVNLEAERKSLGDRWLAEAAHPFYTDLQRIAWRLRAGSSIEYITFPTDSSLDRAVRLDRQYFDVGGIVRIGPPGRLTLFGASLTGDQDVPGVHPVVIGPDGLSDDPDVALLNRYSSHRIARANLLWGVRDISFQSMRGLDALTATQDVPTGFQLGTMFGRSLSVLGSRDDDMFLAGDLYVGLAGKYSAFRIQLQGEGRRNNDDGAWDGIVTTGRAAQYVKTSERNTLIASVEWSGGWNERIPFNLGLDDSRSGVRGFGNLRIVGGQRVVGHLESRWLVGPVTPLGDLGLASFMDVGRLLPGDVPFGSRSDLATSVGISILGAAPRHSARLFRMDIALAIHGNTSRRLEVRFSGADNTKFFFREPSDVERSRELTVASSVFRWP